MEFCAINFPELASQVNAKKENIPVVQHSRWGPFFRRLLIHPVEQKVIMTRGTIVGQRYPNVQTLTCQLRVDRRKGDVTLVNLQRYDVARKIVLV